MENMRLKELKEDLKLKIAAVDDKIQDVEHALKHDKKNSAILQETLTRLKAKREEILLEYDQISAMETEDETRYPKLRTSLHGHLSSFDSIYERAGNLISEGGYGRRNRSIDFKNPMRTK